MAVKCQLCKVNFEDINALQLHQVGSCEAIEQGDLSLTFEDETVEVVFKWIIDRVISEPSVFLLGSEDVDISELKKCTSFFKSDKVTIGTGKYSGQLVIDNVMTPVNDFTVTLLSEEVLIVSKSEEPKEITSPPGEMSAVTEITTTPEESVCRPEEASNQQRTSSPEKTPAGSPTGEVFPVMEPVDNDIHANIDSHKDGNNFFVRIDKDMEVNIRNVHLTNESGKCTPVKDIVETLNSQGVIVDENDVMFDHNTFENHFSPCNSITDSNVDTNTASHDASDPSSLTNSDIDVTETIFYTPHEKQQRKTLE